MYIFVYYYTVILKIYYHTISCPLRQKSSGMLGEHQFIIVVLNTINQIKSNQPIHNKKKIKTVMVNKSANIYIYKPYNYLSPSLTEKRGKRHMTLEIQVLAWDRHTNVAGLNRVMRSKLYSTDDWISNDNT